MTMAAAFGRRRMGIKVALKRLVQVGSAGVLVVPTASFSYWYLMAATDRQQQCLADIRIQMPDIIRGGWKRFFRSAWSGLVISLDYKVLKCYQYNTILSITASQLIFVDTQLNCETLKSVDKVRRQTLF